MREIKEGYKPIQGYKNYIINKQGEVLNTKTNRPKKATIANTGYYTVTLYKKNKGKSFLLHRLIADCFIAKEQGKTYINHKNGIKTDNRIENLEWCTQSENMHHSYEKLGRVAGMKGKKGKKCKNSKPILMLTTNGKPIRRFDSIMCAQRELGFLNNSIVAHLKGRSKTSYGYIWRYENV